jgi:hypothetical protein
VSSIRMCDKAGCGRIFSENEEDWSTGVVTVQRRRENGSRFAEQRQMDLCAQCATGAPPAPALLPPEAIAAGPAEPPTAAEQADAAEREDDHVLLRQLQDKIDFLERRAGTRFDLAPDGPFTATATVASTVIEPDRM